MTLPQLMVNVQSSPQNCRLQRPLAILVVYCTAGKWVSLWRGQLLPHSGGMSKGMMRRAVAYQHGGIESTPVTAPGLACNHDPRDNMKQTTVVFNLALLWVCLSMLSLGCGLLYAGTVVSFRVQNRYNTYDYGGAKYVVISTNSWVGGKNNFLGILYITVGAISLLISIAFFCIFYLGFIKRRKFADLSELSWNKKRT